MKILDKSLQIAYELFPARTDKFIHFAFLFERNKLLSIGQNNMNQTSGRAAYFAQRYNVKALKEFAFAHAEIDAISKIWTRIRVDNRLKLVVVRIGQSGKLLNSKPCGKCQPILDALGLTKIWWSTEEGFANER